jgi:DNA-directed RNA polymerase subunit M/transcription elongation factor TFIIS
MDTKTWVLIEVGELEKLKAENRQMNRALRTLDPTEEERRLGIALDGKAQDANETAESPECPECEKRNSGVPFSGSHLAFSQMCSKCQSALLAEKKGIAMASAYKACGEELRPHRERQANADAEATAKLVATQAAREKAYHRVELAAQFMAALLTRSQYLPQSDYWAKDAFQAANAFLAEAEKHQ